MAGGESDEIIAVMDSDMFSSPQEVKGLGVAYALEAIANARLSYGMAAGLVSVPGSSPTEYISGARVTGKRVDNNLLLDFDSTNVDGVYTQDINTADTINYTAAKDGYITQSRDSDGNFELSTTSAPSNAVYTIDLSSNPGWTTTGSWAYGTPTGGGNSSTPGGPMTGRSGPNVYGYNLSGDYGPGEPAQNLTSPAFNMSTKRGATLQFYRWLGVERSTWDHAKVQVSNNGSVWTTIWENPDSTIEDADWSEQNLDISAVADGQSTVYLRWVMGPTDGFFQWPGWYIDDITLIGTENVAPFITNQSAITMAEDTSREILKSNLTVTDPDDTYPGDHTLTVQNGSNYTHGGNTITPTTNFFGTLTVPVRVNDGIDDSNTFNLSVIVSAVDDATVRVNGSTGLPAGSGGLGTVAAPFDSISDGLANVTSSGTILAAPHSYNETLTGGGAIDQAVTVQRDGGGTVIIGTGSRNADGASNPDASNGTDGADGAISGAGGGLAANGGAGRGSADDSDGETTVAALDTTIFEPVIPFTQTEDGAQAMQFDSVLAVRLRAGSPIDTSAIWGALPEDLVDSAVVDWQEAQDSDSGDVWVILRPTDGWPLTRTVEVTAGATTADGGPAGPKTFEFRVEDEDETRASQPAEAIAQPEYDGEAPAENVEGWLVPGSYLVTEADGTTYLGFLVRHAAILQMGILQAE